MEAGRALGTILVRRGVLSADAAEQLYSQQQERGVAFTDLLVQGRLATEADVARALAEECGLPYVETIRVDAVAPAVAARLPIGYSRGHKLLVVAERDDAVEVVCGDPLDTAALDDEGSAARN